MSHTRTLPPRFAIEQALADYHLSDSSKDGAPSPKFSLTDILTPTPKSPLVTNVSTPRRSNTTAKSHGPNRPGALRRQSSLDTFDRTQAKKERVEALKHDGRKSRSERSSIETPRPPPGTEETLAEYYSSLSKADSPRIGELRSEGEAQTRPNSIDVPRSPLDKPISEQHTGASDYDSVAAEFGLGPIDQEDMNEYTVWNASVTNMRVCPSRLDGGLYFYVETRSFIPRRPGVTIHAGSDKAGRVVGVAHLDYFSTNNMLGVGDLAGNPHAVTWHKLHRNHGNAVEFLTHVKYSFEVDDDVTGKTRKFEWHRTKNLPILDDQGDLVLVEAGRHDVLAEYKGKGPLGQVKKQRGSLKIRKMEELGDEWEMLVLLGWASIVEMSRRRARMRRSSVFRAGII